MATGSNPDRATHCSFGTQARAGQGLVTARIKRDGAGGFSVNVRPHEQTLAEFAEQIEAPVAAETATAAGVGLGRRLVASLSLDEVQELDRRWLEGCVPSLDLGAPPFHSLLQQYPAPATKQAARHRLDGHLNPPVPRTSTVSHGVSFT